MIKIDRQTISCQIILVITVAEDNLNLEMPQGEFFDNTAITTSSHAAMVQQVVFEFKNSNSFIQLSSCRSHKSNNI